MFFNKPSRSAQSMLDQTSSIGGVVQVVACFPNFLPDHLTTDRKNAGAEFQARFDFDRTDEPACSKLGERLFTARSFWDALT